MRSLATNILGALTAVETVLLRKLLASDKSCQERFMVNILESNYCLYEINFGPGFKFIPANSTVVSIKLYSLSHFVESIFVDLFLIKRYVNFGFME